jgi:hypothetical protein
MTTLIAICLLAGVASESDLKSELSKLDTQDVSITIEGTIKLPSGLPIVRGNEHHLTVKGGTLDFSGCVPDGWPIRCRSLTLSGVTIQDYEGHSQAIDLQSTERVVIAGCTFQRIGRNVYPPLRVPTTQASDTIYSQAIGGWSGKSDVRIHGCLFIDVGGGQVRYSHPVYLRERAVIVTGCTFRRCGGSVALEADGIGPIFSGNTWEAATRGNELYVSWQYPDFWYGGGKPAVVVNNRIIGPVRWVWGGYCEKVVQYNNDWSAAEPSEGVWWPVKE